MKIGFFWVDTKTETAEQNYLCARAMVASAKQYMPYIEVVHFTDGKTKPIKHTTTKRKPSEPMALLRMRHHASVNGEWLFIDTDVVFQRNVRRVFRSEFDIAVTSRNWSHLKPAVGFSERMPFNTGVVFSRCPHFWSEVYTRLRNADPELQQWMGDQEVICEIALEEPCRYFVRRINGARFNFPPVLEDPTTEYRQKLADAWIVHYKGPERKHLLIGKESRKCA